MKSFQRFVMERQCILELLDKPLAWKWGKQTNRSWEASFTTPNGLVYGVDLDFYNGNASVYDAGTPYVTLTFAIDDRHTPTEVLVDLGYDVGPSIKPSGITRTGDELFVFATVAAILKDFRQAADVPPWQYMEFTAAEPSRRQLYDRFLTLIKHALPDSEFAVTASGNDYEKHYKITKKAKLSEQCLVESDVSRSRRYDYEKLNVRGLDWDDMGWLGSDGWVYRPKYEMSHADMAMRSWGLHFVKAIGQGNVRFGVNLSTKKPAIVFEYMDSKQNKDRVLRYLETVPADENITVRVSLYVKGRPIDMAGHWYMPHQEMAFHSVHEALLKLRSRPIAEQYITELLDQPLPWKWLKQLPKWWQANFTTPNGLVYRCNFNFYSPASAGGVDMQFDIDTDNTPNHAWAKVGYPHGVIPAFKPTGITKTGDALYVLATVVAIFKNFIQKAPTWQRIDFAAQEESRRKVYDRLTDLLRRSLPKDKFEVEDDVEGSFAGAKYYRISKKEN